MVMHRGSPGNWSADKVQFRGRRVDRFEPGAADPARPRGGRAAAQPARGLVPRRRARGPAPARASGCRRAASWPATSASRAGWWCSASTSCTPRATWSRDRARPPASPPTARPAAPAAPTRRTAPRPHAVDFVPAVPDLAGFPRDDWAWAVREATRDGADRGVRLPGAGRAAAAARGAGQLPEPGARRGGRPRPDRHLHRLLAGAGARAAGARRARRHPGRVRGPRLRRDRRHRGSGGRRRGGAGAGRRARRRRLGPGRDPGRGRGADAGPPVADRRRALAGAAARPRRVGRRHAGAWVVEDDYDAEFRYDHARSARSRASRPSGSSSSARSASRWRRPCGSAGWSARSTSSTPIATPR